MAGIDANLDDLQAGVEASSRAADSLQADARRYRPLTASQMDPSTLVSITRYTAELQTCAEDQRAALQELRKGVTELRIELARAQTALPSLSVAHDRRRR